MRQDLARRLTKWQGKYPKLINWVEANIEETPTYYRLPLAHHKHMKSTNMLERLNQELKRRTRVVRIFPNTESCPRLIRAPAVETHENRPETTRYLNMAHPAEHNTEMRRGTEQAEAACTLRGRYDHPTIQTPAASYLLKSLDTTDRSCSLLYKS